MCELKWAAPFSVYNALLGAELVLVQGYLELIMNCSSFEISPS